MKAVHLVTTDLGGAYKAAERINEAMTHCGIDSRIIVRVKFNKNSPCEQVLDSPVKSLMSKIKNLGNILLSNDKIHSELFGTNIIKNQIVAESNIIIFHWINRFLSYKNVENVLKTGKPVIWVIHDMWLFTGGCHYSDKCFGYEAECVDCPYIRRKKIGRRNYKKKKSILARNNISIVGPSKWIIKCANKSSITKGIPKYIIHNPIDTDIYKPLNLPEKIKEFKAKYEIRSDKKIILLGAMGTGIGDIKGFSLLEETLRKMDSNRYVFMLFGNHEWLRQISDSVQVVNLGFISSERELIQIYNVADVFLSLSKQDNYPNVILEALACGTPVVSFGTGGIPEQVFHKNNGYIARMGDIDDIVAGIEWIVGNDLKTGQSLLMTDNSYFTVGGQYKQICEKLLNGR